MREAVLIGAYTNTIEKELTLIETILDWKKYNLPVILSTHYPVNNNIQNLVDYYIFDKEQYLDPAIMNQHIYSCSSFEIVANFDRPYHAPAALIAYQNAIRLLDNKYDFIYLQDYDVMLNKNKIFEYTRSSEFLKYNMFMCNWYNIPDSYATNTIFFRNNYFTKLWGDIRIPKDFLDLVRSTGSNNLLIEGLAKRLISIKNLKDDVYIFNNDQRDEFLGEFTKHMADDNIPRIYLASTTQNQHILFIVNPTGREIEFQLNGWEFITNKVLNKNIILHGNLCMYWTVYNENTKLTITYENNKKIYNILPGEIYRECNFIFKDSTPIKCK
jgi:hypothetical protein